MTGGYDGTQAEYLQVPFADINLLEVSEEDYKALGGDIVGVWGAIEWAKYRGAEKIIAIDCVPERLIQAREIGAEIIDYQQDKDVVDKMKEVANVALECVGFRYATRSTKHQVEKALLAETDSIEALDDAVKCVKGGRLSLIGDFLGTANHFPIGAIMEKSITIRGSQVLVQKYWNHLLPIIRSGKVNLNIFTHRMKLTEAPKAYKIFDQKENGMIKVFLSVDDLQ
ncbi:hypothetical protein C1645_820364 [Glomus cerebriforme]|uniref:Alcohol dehydrogenase-like C-terminal domain-containing protein n=1 Tax=Glomus cerebriforme TaxID=658196 RepID=A0A397TCK4_9GLOM|nr:hypothetical protein C1645_820364 [Glomus cerebriforme]